MCVCVRVVCVRLCSICYSMCLENLRHLVVNTTRHMVKYDNLINNMKIKQYLVINTFNVYSPLTDCVIA